MKKTFLSIAALLVLCANNLIGQIDFPETEGWEKAKKEEYNTENLWEYINGAADYYLNYGFEKLEVVEYQRSENEYIKLEIYGHGTPLNAFGIYAFERPPEATFLNLGAEGYIEHSALNMYGNTWYVKIHSHQSDEGTISAIKDLAKKVSQLMGDKVFAPDVFRVLPKDDRIIHSEKYYPSNFMGLSFFNKVVSARYHEDGSEYTVFTLEDESGEKALEVVQKYLDFANTGKDAVADKIFKVEDPFNGKVYIKAAGSKISGILELDTKKMVKVILD